MDNSDQIDFWNGPGGEQWAKNQETMDKDLQPFSVAALNFAAPQPGEKTLDVGCGCGDTTLGLSDRVGLDGIAIGLDISEPMIARAKERSAAYETMGLPSPRFVIEDASLYTPKVPNFDLVFSRFGVMFFAEPVTAFKNIRAALRGGGRLAFLCWQPLPLNEWFAVPMAAAYTVLPAPTQTPPANAPGPFAFADQNYVESILTEAGFRDIRFESLELEMNLGPVADLEAATKKITSSGPLSRVMNEVSDEERPKVLAAVSSALEEKVTDGHIKLGTKTWLVGAKNP